MAREYAVSFENLTLAGAVTALFINPGTTMSLEILRAWLAQSGTSTSGQCRVQLVRQVSAFPTLISTNATPRALKDRDPASAITAGTAGAAGTCGFNASAEGAGAKTPIMSDAFNNLNGWLWVPTPNETIVLAAASANGFGLYFPGAPANLTGWSGGIIFRELG
jgi:hypothetical protein